MVRITFRNARFSLFFLPSMLHARARLLPVLATILSVACSRAETPSAQASEVTVSPGDVAPSMTGPTGAAEDSLSKKADRARIRGAETAQVWLVEISDFQCPWCKQWHDSTFTKIDQEYVKTGKIRMAYLN